MSDEQTARRKRAEIAALQAGLAAVRAQQERAAPTLAVTVPEVLRPAHLKVVPKESPVDRVRAIHAAHPVPEDWRTKLAAIAPESLTTSWLLLAWLDRAERWIVYEMIPAPNIPTEKREQLAGTPWWKMPATLQQGRHQMVSAFQWEMYRKYRCWARPFWCLQGSAGGTPARYTEREEAVLRAQGLDTSPPAPGVLPYAPFDGLAERQIRARDRLAKMNGSLDRIKRSGTSAVMIAETAEAERAFRETFWSWWTETMQPQAEFLDWFGKSGDRTAGVNPGLLRAATDEEVRIGHDLKDTYIETGAIPITRAET